jgi:uncharacterized protein YcfJ
MLKKIIAARALALSLPLLAQANDYVSYTTVSQPRQECWNERVAVNYGNHDGVIVGGIAGGIIGNQIGQGNGRVVATAVGAATGAIVGERLSNHSSGYRTVQRCRTVYDQVRVPVAVREVREVRDVSYVEEREKHPRHPRHHRHHRHHHHHHNEHCGHGWYRNNY